MRKVLAILFLLIFTFQVIPLKVWGKLGCSQSMSEEVEDDAQDFDDGKVLKFGEDQIVTTAYTIDIAASSLAFNSKVTATIHRAESLPSVHVAEMSSPPPDFC